MTMMADKIVNPSTLVMLKAFLNSDSHGLLLIGPNGSGKETLLRQVAKELGSVRPEQVIIVSEDGPSISINTARSLKSRLNFKPLKDSIMSVVIPNAEKLTTEAQNALLKLLEEPPENTYFLLSVANQKALLPTVYSRLTTVNLSNPTKAVLEMYLLNAGVKKPLVDQSLLLSKGHVGMAVSLANGTDDNFILAIAEAKKLLSLSLLERLLMIDKLTKNKEQLPILLSAIERVLHVGLDMSRQKQLNHSAWAKKLESIEESISALNNNVSTRLVLTRLMLQL